MFCSFAKHNLFTLKSLDIKVFVSVVGWLLFSHLVQGKSGPRLCYHWWWSGHSRWTFDLQKKLNCQLWRRIWGRRLHAGFNDHHQHYHQVYRQHDHYHHRHNDHDHEEKYLSRTRLLSPHRPSGISQLPGPRSWKSFGGSWWSKIMIIDWYQW